MSEQQQARILIAEDEANLRLVLQKELERLGYRVQAAPDGEVGRAFLKLAEELVAVVSAKADALAGSSGPVIDRSGGSGGRRRLPVTK